MTQVPDYPDKGNCYKCKVETTGEGYCFGCKEFICDTEDCSFPGFSLANATGHGHHPEDHWADGESDPLESEPEW